MAKFGAQKTMMSRGNDEENGRGLNGETETGEAVSIYDLAAPAASIKVIEVKVLWRYGSGYGVQAQGGGFGTAANTTEVVEVMMLVGGGRSGWCVEYIASRFHE